ncbi:DNA methylase N-4/N-6 domain protein [Geomicrobium sp. JCM 19055]|nr:site-specific DNA-methyltransferase [Geomicrobium sp. JCM 19055]GAK00888.1 DNA methylase N-4/N-6 domain protein [Geomicrobium sp. JCM 19055]
MNTVHNLDCLEGMKGLGDGSVDLTVTSPPYDDIRGYHGFEFDVEKIVPELYRVTKDGGVVVWVVGDRTVKGSESGTSFKQALLFMEQGFRLHDTMIYRKKNPMPQNHGRYEQSFEYMFVFSKGKPNTFNGLREQCVTAGSRYNYATRQSSSSVLEGGVGRNRDEVVTTKDTKLKGNVWEYSIGIHQSTKDKVAFQHPAIFPEKLAEDHILSWSNSGDVVLDPFAGSALP